MYRCDNCGEMFDFPSAFTEDTGVTADIGAFGAIRETKDYEACPHCGSEDITDVYDCPCCGEPAASGSDFCEDCKIELVDELKLAIANFRTRKENRLHRKIEDNEINDLMTEIIEGELI